MLVERIPVVIIQTPNSERFRPLVETIGKSELFEIILVVATMGHSLVISDDRFVQKEVYKYGRELTQNERACAVSHSRGREIIAKSKLGGIIFEDDARVINLEYLEEVTAAFLTKFTHASSILGLLQYSERIVVGSACDSPLKFRRLFAEIPLAVASVLTPRAARELLDSSALASQTADWPKSKCRFYVLSTGCVRHGDATSGTVIGDTTKRINLKTSYPISINGISYTIHRFLQKLDTFLIRYFQSR